MEQWKVMAYNDEIFKEYEVSTKGRIRNAITGHILKNTARADGYRVVTVKDLYEKRKYVTKYVHRAVGCTWIYNDNPTIKTEINHIDEDKSNNCVENLEWSTPSDQIHHGTRTERAKKSMRETVGKRVKCVELDRIFDSLVEASEFTKAHRNAIQNVLAGRVETAGGYHWELVD